MSVHLPVYEPASRSLREDGGRNYVHPADVRGRFTGLRRVIFPILIAVLVALPFVRMDGRPAAFLDVENRKFFLFGASFNAQDFWLSFFILSGIGFALIVLAALLGRVWCGYACPQTVFMEGLFRRIERLIEGPRAERLRRNAGPWNLDKLWRKGIKQVVFAALAVLLAHVFLSYFVSMPALADMMTGPPSAHPEAFTWMGVMSLLLYGNFSWFREQLCLIICPYGRLQSALNDSNTINVGYDAVRGEPRGKASDPETGDCIDCKRCIVVCPTGIDIRNGLQIDCIGCANCVDACDEIMDKVSKPRGLIRYDSLNGLEHKPKRFLRPRLVFYGVAGLVGLVVAGLSFRQRAPFEANLLRLSGAPYTVADGEIRNAFELHLVNKSDAAVTFRVTSQGTQLHYVIPTPRVRVAPLASVRMPIFVTQAADKAAGGRRARLRVALEQRDDAPKTVTAPFLTPGR